MEAQISDPRTDADGLDDLAPLWRELHRHHREVSGYGPLVEDLDASWASRRRWYRALLAQGASYLTATDPDGGLIGYAMVALNHGPDDTFEVMGGVAEVVSLAVTQDRRSAGVGRALLAAAERIARDHGFDTVKIAVMSGNARALAFYETNGYSVGEHVLYRRLDTQ
jgi:GNAT superfamily N-acetyltransferase